MKITEEHDFDISRKVYRVEISAKEMAGLPWKWTPLAERPEGMLRQLTRAYASLTRGKA